jgi:hypothetical protein
MASVCAIEVVVVLRGDTTSCRPSDGGRPPGFDLLAI